MRLVDAHCFAGGLVLGTILGMDDPDVELVAKKESKGAFGAPMMEVNRHLLRGPWETQAGDYTEWEPTDADVVLSNPPCSGFSLLSNRNWRGVDSPANACMWGVAEYAARVKPTIWVMESVQAAYRQGRPLMQELRARLEALSGLRYDITHVLHSARSCGNPQVRNRYLLVCSQVPFGMEPPEAHLYPTVREAIADLELMKIPQWGQQRYHRPTLHPWSARSANVEMVDGMVGMDNPHAHRLEYLLSKVRWEEGEHLSDVVRRCHEEGHELPELWQRQLPRLKATGWNMSFFQPIRLRGNHTCPVMTGAALGNFVHYRENRLLTHREVARLMGFPDSWQLERMRNVKGAASFYGKGVTVDVGRWLGTWLKSSLEGTPGDVIGEEIGDRERLIDVTNLWKRRQAQQLAA